MFFQYAAKILHDRVETVLPLVKKVLRYSADKFGSSLVEKQKIFYSFEFSEYRAYLQ